MDNGDTNSNRKVIAAVITLLITFGLVTESAQAQDPDVWTYDFADIDYLFPGEEDDEDETNPEFLPSTQLNGGDTRVRVFDGENNEIEFTHDGNDIGTFSRAVVPNSGSTTSFNIFGIGDFVATEHIYVRASISLTVDDDMDGDQDFFIFANGEDSFTSTGINTSDTFAGLRFQIQDDENNGEQIEVSRRTSGWSTAFGFGVIDHIDVNEKITVEIIGNNSDSETSFFRNGEEVTLSDQQYIVYLNEERITGNYGPVTANIDENVNIASIRFAGGRGEDATIEIDDLVYANHLPVYREITGEPGWRMLSSPTDGLDATTLSRQNQVQGSIGDVGFGGSPNLYRFDPEDTETTPDSSWAKPADENEVFSSGEGFIWYLFDNDNFLPSKPLPMGLVSKGDVPNTDVTVSLHQEDVDDGNSSGQSKWNLVGNPFGRDLDVSDLEEWANNGSLESATAQVWDNNDDSYVVVSDNSEKIAAFQGFFIENDDADELVIPADAQTDDATFYREAEDDIRLLSLKLAGTNSNNGGGLTDRAANVYFHPEAETGWDMWSASKLTPLSASHISLGFIGERDSGERVLAQSSLPSDIDEEITLPLTISGTPDVSGSFEIGIESLENIPEEWEITATNTTNGSSYDLRADNPVIELNGTQQARSWQKPVSENALTVSAPETQDESDEWVLTITPQDVTSSEPGTEVPEEITLDQNYPNPFNPVTTISFALPEDSEIQLEVYDVMGRKVTTLVDEQRSAGEHEVSWDASGVSSGTYMYRLQVGDQVQTNTMTLIK